MRKLLASLFIAFCVFASNGFAQEITETVKKEQEEVIKILKKDNMWKEKGKEKEFFSAHVIVGLYYYNQALPIHEEISKGDLNDHIKEDPKLKDLEMKQNQYLSKALPYFENAYYIQRNDKVGNKIKDIYKVMGKKKKLENIDRMNDL